MHPQLQFELIHAPQSIYHSNVGLKQQQHNLCLSHKQGKKEDNAKEVFVLACNRNHNPLLLPKL